ncbi:MAG: UDP-N-acetylglucosamine 1-carboxyvinyltransferase [Clostridia bacterium]|nr:UDP-N-acetylglucosamine 1-carboxyvinyltransferase [Clostridia bacterium]
MGKFIVAQAEGLKGSVKISGSKNSALPIIAASILCGEEVKLKNIPGLSDVKNLCEIIASLGGNYNFETGNELSISLESIKDYKAPYDMVNKLRASFLIMAPLLARNKKVRIPLPGGCPIGTRPIDLHLKGFSAMGAKISTGHGFVEAKCKKLTGTEIYLDFPSVGATENLMIAGSVADGKTVIENCATEPEIVDLANFLNKMGARIENAGTDKITIYGVEHLSPCEYTIIPDRIEAGTFLTAGIMKESELIIENIVCDHLRPVIAKYTEMGAKIEEKGNCLKIKNNGKITNTDIKTLPFPGFPTDMQAMATSLMCIAEGRSVMVETVFENRFLHIPELCRMGANIKVDGRTAIIDGGQLTGAKVKATDLRAGAALVLAGICAKGKTEIDNIEFIERGYENLDQKLKEIGVNIKKVQ